MYFFFIHWKAWIALFTLIKYNSNITIHKAVSNIHHFMSTLFCQLSGTKALAPHTLLRANALLLLYC